WRPGGSPSDDESTGSLLSRRLGEECAGVLVGPLLAGVNSGDPDRLSIRATFPELADWEGAHGSLIRGSRAAGRAAKTSSGRGGPMFASLRGGLQRLIDALVDRIGPDAIRLQTMV